MVVNRANLYEPDSVEPPFYGDLLQELATEMVNEMFNIKDDNFAYFVHAELDKLVICCGQEVYRQKICRQNKLGIVKKLQRSNFFLMIFRTRRIRQPDYTNPDDRSHR